MKKILAGLMAAATVASTAMGIDGSATATSANAVGFITFPAVEAQKYICLTIPFTHVGNSADGDQMIDISELQFATDAPEGSRIWYWTGSIWEPHEKQTAKGEPWVWDEEEEEAPQPYPGQAILFQPSEDMDSVVLAGQVPADASCPVYFDATRKIPLDAIGNPYPVPLVMSNSTLGVLAPEDAAFWQWNGKTWDKLGVKSAPAGVPFEDEDPDEFVLVIPPGEGIFFDVRYSGEDTWQEYQWEAAKPYTWP